MKGLPVAIVPSVMLILMSFVPSKHTTFNGEIMDSQCGEMGLHDVVVNTIKTAKECTIDCVRIGGKYVLCDPPSVVSHKLLHL